MLEYAVIFPSALKSGGNNEYSIANIPASMLNNNGVVIRKKIIQIEIKSEKRAVETVTEAYTIFKRDNQDLGRLVLWYDKFRKIDDLDGELYDAKGNEIRDLSSNDIKDFCSFSIYDLYNDTRKKVAELFYDNFPYTVEFTYKLKYDGYIELPAWYSRSSIYPVQLTRFEVLTSKEDSLRIWCNSDSLKPDVSIDGDDITYIWEEKNLPELSEAREYEDEEDYSDIVRIAPTNFVLDDYEGKMETWKNFGLWVNDLYKGQDKLSDEAKNKIRSLYTPEDGDTEIVKKLYHYMQSTTRYVSITLGIGGWKPLDAQFVFDKGYGDCKALVNYMKALLETAGIDSYPALVNTENLRPLITEFPSNQFDHVILCVPVKKDTIWLECTNQTIPFSHLSYLTENKNVLLLSDNGGILARTPSSTPSLNTLKRIVSVILRSNGTIDVNLVTGWRGDQQDGMRSRLEVMTPEEKSKWVTNSLNASSPDIRNYNFVVPEISGKDLKLNMKFYIPHYGSVSGKRIFFKPDLISRNTFVPRDIPEPQSPVRFGYPYTDSDSITYKIPKNFFVEAIPSEVNLNTSFGKFVSKTVQINDSVLVFKRVIEIKSYIIPPKNYSEFRNFFADIVKADRSSVVLIKKE